MKFTFFFVTLALVDAFAPPRPISRPCSALQVEIMGSEVSESVLAAVSLAVIGGAAVASGLLGTKAAPGETAAIPAPAPAQAQAPEPEPEPEPEAAAPEEPSDDVSIPYLSLIHT